jgi:Mg2+ and Co2+ transporter CorA
VGGMLCQLHQIPGDTRRAWITARVCNRVDWTKGIGRAGENSAASGQETAFETSNLLEQQRQSIITRQLAGWAATLGVPTVIAAIYDMTLQSIPEIQAAHGFAIVIGVMMLVCVGLYIRFRKLRWL